MPSAWTRVGLAAVLVAEFLYLTVRFDTQSLDDAVSPWLRLVAWSPQLLRLAISVGVVLLLISARRVWRTVLQERPTLSGRVRMFSCLVHVVALLAFFQISSRIFDGRPPETGAVLWVSAWFLSALTMLASWVVVFLARWPRVKPVMTSRSVAVAAVGIGVLGWVGGYFGEGLWRSASGLTFGIVETILGRLPSGPVRLQVVFPVRSLSKVPFVIAYEQGLFEKHGLNVSIWMPPKEGESDIPPSRSARPERPDIFVDGHSPIIYRMVTEANFPPMIALAGGDCMARMHIVGQRGLARLEDLKGKRLGVNRPRSTSAYVARLLVRRMGWDPLFDISILEFGFDADSLRTGAVDAIVAPERAFAELQAEGYPVLANSLDWNEPMAGNSVLVEREWLKAPGHRDLALRFLKASAEGFALFHRDPELARRVMARWNGIMGDEHGETIYDRGDSFPRKPYPCYDGIKKSMELYDSNEMRRYTPEDFYDDSLMRELDDSGFLDGLYK